MTSMATQAWLDQDDHLTVEMIRRYGWRIIYVLGEEGPDGGPAFGYTVGLFGLGHPELLITGVSFDLAVELLTDLCLQVREGENLLPHREIRWAGWERRLTTEQVPNPEDLVFEANRFYRRPPYDPVSVLQLSFADGRGRFPWDRGYDGPDQPRPGTFTA